MIAGETGPLRVPEFVIFSVLRELSSRSTEKIQVDGFYGQFGLGYSGVATACADG